MTKRRWIVVTAAVAVVAIALVVAVALRSGLAQDRVRHAVEQRLSATLGQPVTIGALHLSLSPRLSLSGTDVRVGGTEPPSTGVGRITVVPRVRSLFGGPIVIDDVRLDEFAVAVLRTPDGGWRVPAVAPAPAPDSEEGIVIERVRISDGRIRVLEQVGGATREAAGIDDIEAELLPAEAGLRIAPLSGRVGTAAISGEAHVSAAVMRLEFAAPAVRDADLVPLLALAGSGRPAGVRIDAPASVSVRLTIDRGRSRLGGEGTVKVPAATVGPLRIERLEAPIAIAGSRLTFAPATFAVSGGSHRGTLVLDVGADPARWSADSRLDRLDTGALLDAVAGRDTKLDGEGRVDADVHGPLNEQLLQAMAGRARLDVERGVLRDFPLLAYVNRTLRLAEAESRDTRFERLSATFAIGEAAATTSDLVVEAAHLRVTAAGRIGFDGALDLRGRATISEARAAEAVAAVRELARLKSGGELAFPLTISGSLDQPQFGLDVAAAVREGARDELLRRLRRIIK